MEFFASGYPSLPDVSPLIIKDPRLSGKIGCQERRKTREIRGGEAMGKTERRKELELQPVVPRSKKAPRGNFACGKVEYLNGKGCQPASKWHSRHS